MDRHFYFLIISHLTTAQTAGLLDKYSTITVADDPPHNPCNAMHWRTRLDGQAALYEAFFNEAAVNPNGNRGRLVSAAGMTPNKINTATNDGAYGPEQHFTHKDTDAALMDVIILGGDSTNWEESRQATLSYLADNSVEWDNDDA